MAARTPTSTLRVRRGRAIMTACIEIDLSKTRADGRRMPFHPSAARSRCATCSANGPDDHPREVELRAHEQFGGKAELHLTDKIEEWQAPGRSGHHRQAAPAACTTTSPRPRPFCDGFRASADGDFLPLRLSPVHPGQSGADPKRRAAGAAGGRRALQALLLRPVLRRRRCSVQTMPSPSATRRATSRTAKARSPETASWPA